MNAEPRRGEVPAGSLLAAAGAVLLVVSLFLDWYEEVSGFTVFEFVDLLLVLLALATVAVLAAELRLLRAAPPPGLSLGLAFLALFVVVFQILNDPPAVAGPEGPDKDLGIWLALAGAALMLAGALLGNARISLAVESRPRERAAGRGGAAEPGPAVSRPDHEATTIADRAPKRPASDDPEPTRPLSDPDAPRAPGSERS